MSIQESSKIQILLDEIAEKLEVGHASVMIGAGFSKNADQRFPSWNDLGIAFYKKLNNTEPSEREHFLNPMKLAGEIKEDFGYKTLFEIIKSNIPDKKFKPSDLHINLLKLPWKDIFTTNYDTLLERASEQVINYRFDIVRTKKELPFSENPRIIKLHGCLEHQKELIITDDDYREYPQKYAPFVNTVLQSLIENTLCLIGFSGEDPNFLNWINWILNNLGQDNSPKIYLVGKLEINRAQRKWLEKRNINLVDLNFITAKTNISHKKAIKSFIDYLNNYLKEKNSFNWPVSSSLAPNQGIVTSELIKIIPEWNKIRQNYPKWLIVPEENRERLWTYTLHWMKQIELANNLDSPHDFNFVYELNWRLEKCLYPIEDTAIDCYEKITDKYSPIDKAIGIKWFELKLSLLRYYREEAIFNKWIETDELILKSEELLTPELFARWQYEKALYYLFISNYEKSLAVIKYWPRDENLSYWEIKKGSLLAEFGYITEGLSIIENALKIIRAKLNLTPIKNDFELVSFEAYAITLHHYISLSKKVIERDFNGITATNNEEFERLDVLKSYRCSPWNEIKLFELKLTNRENEIIDKIESYGFDLGNITRTINFGPKQEIIDAYKLFRFFEEIGVPFGLKGVNILGKKALYSSIRLITPFSLHWAIINLIRTGDIELAKKLFSRHSILNLKSTEIDILAVQYIETLYYSLQKLDLKKDEILIPSKLCGLLPEIISRLLSKSSTEIKDRFLNQILEIYNSDKKWAFNDLSKVIERLTNSYTWNEIIERIQTFLKFPIIKTEPNRINDYFPEPFKSINPGNLKIKKSATIEIVIDKVIDKLDSFDIIERDNALLRAHSLYKWNLLNKHQKDELGQKIWSMVNSSDEFPKYNIVIKSAFVNLPHPKNISPERILKKYIISSEIPLQKNENTFQRYKGNLECPRLIYYGSKRINNRAGIIWTSEELIELFDRLYSWWNHDKKFLLKNDEDEFFSVANEFKLRFKHLVNILTELILPKLPDNIDEILKKKIKNLLDEMQEYGLPCMKVKIASLIIFPEDIVEIEKLIHEKISGKEIDQVENTYMGIYFNTYAHKLKKSISLPESIFETISENIKWRSQPGLFYALDLFIAILNRETKSLNNKELNNTLIGLKNLLKDTDLTEKKSTIFPLEKRIEIRGFAAHLAYELSLSYKKNNQEIPDIITKWKKICEDPEEFIEIRKQWESI